jgi:hypothetical protein
MTLPTLADALYLARLTTGIACAAAAVWVATGPLLRRLWASVHPAKPRTASDAVDAQTTTVRTSKAA